MTRDQIQLREFRTRALGRLFYKMSNDVNTKAGFGPSRCISSLLKLQGTHQMTKASFVSLANTNNSKRNL